MGDKWQPWRSFLLWKRGEPRKLFLMVVVRRVLHGLGDPGGVGVAWKDPSPLAWPTNGGPPLLAAGDVLPTLLRVGDVPPLLYWPGASKRWDGRGDGTGEADGVLLLLLLSEVTPSPDWLWWFPGPGYVECPVVRLGQWLNQNVKSTISFRKRHLLLPFQTYSYFCGRVSMYGVWQRCHVSTLVTFIRTYIFFFSNGMQDIAPLCYLLIDTRYWM